MSFQHVMEVFCSPGNSVLHEYLTPTELWSLSSTCRTNQILLREEGFGVFRSKGDWERWLHSKYSDTKRYWSTRVWNREMDSFMFKNIRRLPCNIVFDLPRNVCRLCGDSCGNYSTMSGWYVDCCPPHDTKCTIQALTKEESVQYMAKTFPAFVHDVIKTRNPPVAMTTMPVCGACGMSITKSAKESQARFRWPYFRVVLGREFYVSSVDTNFATA